MSEKEINRFSLQFNNPERLHIHEAKLSKETLKALGLDKKEKTHIDYFTDYIGKKELDKILSLFEGLIHKSITEEQKKICSKCGENPPDKTAMPLCAVLGREWSMNFYFASWEFITIINNNKNIFIDKEQIKKLTRSFFTCFCFYEGHVYFELKELGRKCLMEGLISISSILANSPVFERFTIINDSLFSLRNEYRYYRLNYNIENEFLKNHIEWYEDQERFYIRKEEIKEKYEKISVNDSDIKNPYPQIFKNIKSFEFFERLLEEYDIANSKTKISILSDIYILMRKDDLIFESFKPTPFVNWLNEKYDFNISKLKELTRTPLVTTKKIYNNSKQLFFTNKE